MIVGAVRQEDESSWSDTCDAWAALDEHAEAGIHQVKMEEIEPGEDDPEEGLLVEGEEREYVLELLLRGASLETRETDRPGHPRSAKPAGKRKRSLGKKHHKKAKVTKRIGSKAAQGSREEPAGEGEERDGPRGRSRNPETHGGDAAAREHNGSSKSAPPPPTLGRECSA